VAQPPRLHPGGALRDRGRGDLRPVLRDLRQPQPPLGHDEHAAGARVPAAGLLDPPARRQRARRRGRCRRTGQLAAGLMTRAAAWARLLLALLILAALLSTAVGAARDGLLAQNLSYFTNQSNCFFAVLVLAAPLLAGGRPPWWDDARGAATFYLAMTGIV